MGKLSMELGGFTSHASN